MCVMYDLIVDNVCAVAWLWYVLRNVYASLLCFVIRYGARFKWVQALLQYISSKNYGR